MATRDLIPGKLVGGGDRPDHLVSRLNRGASPERGDSSIRRGGRSAVVDVMVRLGAMAEAHPELIEVEINLLSARAGGAVALG